jgi:4-azaleucine resistance transporter AzlC
MNKTFRYAIKSTLPVFVGYLFLGIGYGVLMNKAGNSFWLTQGLSLFVFAGALQYAAVGIFANGFAPIAILVLALMVNLRHLFYGLSLIERYKNLGLKKIFMVFGLTDETFSINVGVTLDANIDAPKFYFYVTLLNYLYWNIATSVGFGLAHWVPDTIKGLDFILTALFYVLFLNQWDKKEARDSLTLGLSATLIGLMVVGVQHFLWFAMVLIVAFIAFRYQKDHSS